MSFLNAEWRKLAIANYVIDPSILEKYIPTGTELDLWEENALNRVVEYQWNKNKVWQFFRITAALDTSEIIENSETEFITEHYWGYAKVNNLVTNEYEVTHPKWRHYKIESFEIKVDFGVVYGEDFGFLNKMKLESVMLAEGSKITVEGKTTLKPTHLK